MKERLTAHLNPCQEQDHRRNVVEHLLRRNDVIERSVGQPVCESGILEESLLAASYAELHVCDATTVQVGELAHHSTATEIRCSFIFCCVGLCNFCSPCLVLAKRNNCNSVP